MRYVGRIFEVALFATVHHHARFMAATNEPPGWWTSRLREIVLDVRAVLHDMRGHTGASALFAPDGWCAPQALGARLRA